MEWYKDVQSRAQLALTLDGAFIAILSGAIVAKSSDLVVTLNSFGWDTWVLLTGMAASFVLSILFSMLALLPFGFRRNEIDANFLRFRREDDDARRDPPTSVMWYSGYIKRLERAPFLRYSERMGSREHRAALASQIFALAERLERKYRWVFLGYACAGAGVLTMLLAVGSYLLHIKLSNTA
jgi:hypothetical protein